MVKIYSTVLALSLKHHFRKWLGSFDKNHKDLYERFEQNMMEGSSIYKKNTVMSYLISLASDMDHYDICQVINYAFCWRDTTEGHDYWASIHEEWSNAELQCFYESIPESMTSLINHEI